VKLAYNQIESFARNFNPAQRGVLIYGPDHGLVQERAGQVLAKVLGNPDDPFAMTDLSGGAIKDDPALLYDEVSAMAFFGGRKVIRIREDAEKAAEALKGLFANPPSGKIDELGFVLVLADELDKRSALRVLFEGAADAAALPCYVDEAVGVGQIIREEFRHRQITASADAIAYIANVLRGDRMMVRMEVEKIDLFLGVERDLSLDAARACTGARRGPPQSGCA
jgi:DNA polymerase-3 subunit delta